MCENKTILMKILANRSKDSRLLYLFFFNKNNKKVIYFIFVSIMLSAQEIT